MDDEDPQRLLLNRTHAQAGEETVKLVRVALGVGEVHVAGEPCEVWTVLGSCVAVILFSPKLRISAVCHARLPSPSQNGLSCTSECKISCSRSRANTPLTFVSCCIEHMIDELARLGVQKAGLSAALIGGAQMLNAADRAYAIGLQNVEAARELLKQNAIVISFEDTGGSHGRTLTYATATGKIKVRPPRATLPNPITLRR